MSLIDRKVAGTFHIVSKSRLFDCTITTTSITFDYVKSEQSKGQLHLSCFTFHFYFEWWSFECEWCKPNLVKTLDIFKWILSTLSVMQLLADLWNRSDASTSNKFIKHWVLVSVVYIHPILHLSIYLCRLTFWYCWLQERDAFEWWFEINDILNWKKVSSRLLWISNVHSSSSSFCNWWMIKSQWMNVPSSTSRVAIISTSQKFWCRQALWKTKWMKFLYKLSETFVLWKAFQSGGLYLHRYITLNLKAFFCI